MCIAYNSKVSKFPISKLTDILCLNTETETQKFCERFGLTIVGCSVQLMKNSFKDANVVSHNIWSPPLIHPGAPNMSLGEAVAQWLA